MGVLTGWLELSTSKDSQISLWVNETLPPVLSIRLMVYSLFYINNDTRMCLAQKCIVDVGCTLEMFLCCKQNKVLVYLGCYTLHYIATCGLGV